MFSESDLPLYNPIWKRTKMIIIRVRDRAEFGVGETRNATLRPQKCHKWQIWANSLGGGQKCATAKENGLIFLQIWWEPGTSPLQLSLPIHELISHEQKVDLQEKWKKHLWKCLQNAKVRGFLRKRKEVTFVFKQEVKGEGSSFYQLLNQLQNLTNEKALACMNRNDNLIFPDFIQMCLTWPETWIMD